MAVDLDQALSRVASAVADLPVAAAYVFGSVARAELAPGDLDVALLTAPSGASAVDGAVLADIVARRLADLGEVDVVDLRTAPLRLLGRVLTEGRLAAVADDVERVRFEASSRSLAIEFAPFAEAADRAFLVGLAERDG